MTGQPGHNIVLIMADQHRWDALGQVATNPVRTPTLDHLAREGITFSQAYCNSPLCVPSRMSFLSGRYVHQHRCLDNETTLWPDDPSFVRALRESGYHTANVGKLHYTWKHDLEILTSAALLNRLGFNDPFETTGKMSQGNLRASPYSEHLRGKGLLEAYHRDLLRRAESGPLEAYNLRPSMLDPDDHIDGWVLGKAADWIKDGSSEPFFLWIGPPGPHDPFDPPEPYASMYVPGDVPLEQGECAYPVRTDTTKVGIPSATQMQIQQMRTQYYGNVSFIDDGVATVIAALEQRHLLDRTWIVYCSDHGEMLGDRAVVGKDVPLDPALRVPLIVRPPTDVRVERGVTSDSLVELIDLTATILDIAGATLPGQQGRSLLPVVENHQHAHRDTVISQLGQETVIRSHAWKAVVDSDRRLRHAWHVEGDVHETRDLANGSQPPAAVAELTQQLDEFVASTPTDLADPWPHLVPHAHWPRNPLRELPVQ